MKTILLLLLAFPIGVWAQTETLKPIEIISEPTYSYYQYGHRHGVYQRYTYDGIEVRRPRDLAPYILASGDRNAIQDFQQYVRQRNIRTSMLVAGGSLMFLGGITTTIKMIKSSKTPVLPSGVNYANPNIALDEARRGYTYGLLTAGVGFVIASIGTLATNPNFHLRRSVQYYNRALKQRAVSWQVSPYAGLSHSGLGLVARF